MSTETATTIYLRAAIGYSMGRSDIVEGLESTGTACFDDEDIGTLIDAYISSIESGDLDFPLTHATAQSMPKHIYMLWLEI